MKKIVVDLDGSDSLARNLIAGAIKAINEYNDLYLIIVTSDKNIKESIYDDYNKDRIEFVYTSSAITNNDNPILSFRDKSNSSLVRGLKIANDDKDVIGFVTLGATGAILVSSYLVLGKISKARPSLASTLLSKNGNPFLIIDSGSNIDCRPKMLYNFAKMGSIFMEAACNINNPRIALLSNGSEDSKGTDLVKNTNNILKNSNLNFIGNIEPKDCLMDKADVIVCDGFSGNIVLKTIEGTAKAVVEEINEYIDKSLDKERIISVTKSILEKYDYNTKGGGVLLGVNKLVVKGHGAGDSETIYNTIKIVIDLNNKNLITKLKYMLEN